MIEINKKHTKNEMQRKKGKFPEKGKFIQTRHGYSWQEVINYLIVRLLWTDENCGQSDQNGNRNFLFPIKC